MNDEKLTLNVAEAARLIGISKGLCYDLCRQGQIPVIKVGKKRLLIPRWAFEQWLNNGGMKE